MKILHNINNLVALRSKSSMRVGDLAKRTSKSVRALHLYEELGLLEPVERSKGGYRLFGEDSVIRVRWIEKLQELGFSLNDIGRLLRDFENAHSAPDSMARIRNLFLEKLEETQKQVKRLESLASELENSLGYLKTCTTCDPDTLLGSCSRCEHHEHEDIAPELVAGFQH
jgi:DNA-binding transcriptional MerR regulator